MELYLTVLLIEESQRLFLLMELSQAGLKHSRSCQLDLNGNYMFLLNLHMAKEELDKLLAPILRIGEQTRQRQTHDES